MAEIDDDFVEQMWPNCWKDAVQTMVVVVLHSLTEFLAQDNLSDGFKDIVRWFYNQFELVLGLFTTCYLETDDWVLVASEILHLTTLSEETVDRLYEETYQYPYVMKIDDIGELKGDIEGLIKWIDDIGNGDGHGAGSDSGSGSSSRRFEYERTREKAIQVLNQSLPRTTKGWVVDPEAYFVMDSTKQCDRLVDRVINGGSSPELLDVIMIQGFYNKGMNPLLKKFYGDALIANHFETRAWVLISPIEHNLRNLLISILKYIMMDDITPKEIYDEMEVWELKRELLKQLSDCRYLILLEWVSNVTVSHIEWNEIKDALPKNNKGSQVILAANDTFEGFNCGKLFLLSSASDHRPYSVSRRYHRFFLEMQETEDYFNILSKIIFGEKEFPKELEHLGGRIIEICNLRPQIMIMIACILRIGENTVPRWSNIVAQIDQRPENSLERPNLTRAEFLCYKEMPQHLKTCFLYFCVFPTYFEISVKQLIQMWIAEGLIAWGEINTNDPNKQARSSIEDVAEKDYLEALIALNYIEVTNRRSDGGPKSFRLRGQPCSFCLAMSRLHGYGDPHFDSSQPMELEHKGERRWRLSIQENCEQFLSEVANPYGTASRRYIKSLVRLLRSFSCFSRDINTISEQCWEAFFELSNRLRVLNLGEEEVGKLPKTIERLFHLRYLRVKPTKNIVVPKSIFNLRNLQTLDLRTIRFSELPKGIWWMRQLRHLYLKGDGPSRLPIPESEGCILPNLQTLSYISIDVDDGIHISKKAPNLRKLGLHGYQCFSMSEQEATFNLSYLQKLKFAGECNFEVPITFPNTITKISTGKGIHLQQIVVKMFGKLPNLQNLKFIQTTFDNRELVFEEGSFPQLQLLKFEASNVVTWGLKDGAMPSLHHLIISKCPQLIEPPAELWNMKTLQELDLSRASMKFAKKVRDHLKNNEGSKLVVNFPLSSKIAT